ncbi:MAG: ribosomal RNA small subunit methyltransferase A [Candidatus Aureabacteria bacterium]|nr:ribosomal RNA small subunit methyltransferase A [Candidatus Auribacterota bacterium]
MNLSEVKKILEQEKISPLKRFGQNFLIDSNIARKFAATLDFDEKDTVIEIGPGLGAISSIILQSGCSLIAYEIDRTFSKFLKKKFSSFDNFKLIEGDFLKTGLSVLRKTKAPASLFPKETAVGETAAQAPASLFPKETAGRKIKVISNLPYYLTSSIMFALMENREKISQAVLIMQKEVAERVVAVPGTPDYGLLSVRVQFYCNSKKNFDINRNAFYPRPDVISTAMKLEFLGEPRHKVQDIKLFENILKVGFAHRRKQLRKAVAELLGSRKKALEAMEEANIDCTVRIEELGIDKITRLSNVIYSKLR